MATGYNFETLVGQFLSPDNAVRGTAEAQIQELRNLPDVLGENLVTVLRSSQNEQIRAVSAVLVRKTITKDYWPGISPAAQAKLKAELLAAVENEPVGSIRKKISDTIGEIASFLEEGQWPELLPFLFRCANAASPGHRESALQIFGQLPFDQTLTDNLGVLHQLLVKSLQDPESPDVRLAAVRAVASVLPNLENKQRSSFGDALPLMIQVLNGALQATNEGSARNVLEELIDIADSVPSFIKPQAQLVLEAMYRVASTRELEDATRHLAVECLVTLAEKAPVMVRKMPVFTQHIFPLALNMMLEIEDDADWHEGGQGDEDDNEYTSYDVGEEALDRLAISLGGKTLLPIAFAENAIPAFLANADWRYRHAALMTISQIGEGCQKQMQEQLQAVIAMLLQHFLDPHPRVRWAAINAVGQLSTDFGPGLQTQFHAQVLPSLVAVMDDAANPRVQSHAAAAVINFTENCEKKIMEVYLERVLTKLLLLLQNGKRIVQEQAITAIASVADCAEELFRPYYAATMPLLKQILLNANDKTDRMLRGKAMECVSLIGIAVGRDVFAADAKEIMDMMMHLQTTEMDPDDPQVSYLLQAWGRIAKCLNEAFVPYLQVVMPPLLKSAELQPDIQVSDADDAEVEDNENLETITINNKRISISTSVLEEKATACNMICCYVSELKEGFFPYIDPVAKIMVPLMKFIYHDEVRSAAVTCMPELVKCAIGAAEKGQCDRSVVKSLLDFIMGTLLEAVTAEPDIDVLVAMANSIHECVDAVGENCLSREQVELVVEAVRVIVVESNERRDEREEKKEGDDYDEEEGELLEEENNKEEELLDEAASAVGCLVKQVPALFFECAQPVLVHFGAMLQAEHGSAKRIGLCVFCDIFEHGKGMSAGLLPNILPFFMSMSTDEDAECRQAAVYGLGVVAQHCQAQFAPSAMDAAGKLVGVITAPNARASENEGATDNAIAALGKICEFQAGGQVNVPEIATHWLSYLPLTADSVEGRGVSAQLAHLCESNTPWLIGEGGKNVPRLVAVFAAVLGTEFCDDATTPRIAALLQRWRQELPQALTQQALLSAWGSIPTEHMEKLKPYLS